MIINSDFKDFYDFAAHQWRDPKVVYNREHEELFRRGMETPKELISAYNELAFGISSRVGIVTDESSVDAVVIGGKVYQYHHARRSDEHGNFTKSYFKEEDVDTAARNGFRKWFRTNFREYKWGEHVAKFNDLCVKYGPIIWFHDGGIDINPCFNYHDRLMKVADAHTIVQDIMSCIGSVEPHIPEMDDLTKVEAAGFDKKQSFRHRK